MELEEMKPRLGRRCRKIMRERILAAVWTKDAAEYTASS
jgi:hypothetical protein